MKYMKYLLKEFSVAPIYPLNIRSSEKFFFELKLFIFFCLQNYKIIDLLRTKFRTRPSTGLNRTKYLTLRRHRRSSSLFNLACVYELVPFLKKIIECVFRVNTTKKDKLKRAGRQGSYFQNLA